MLFRHVSLQPSIRLIVFISLIHLGALICIVQAPIPQASIKIIILILCSYSAGYCMRRYGLLLHPLAARELAVDAQGEWYLRMQNGKVFTARLQGDSLVTTKFMALNFKLNDKTKTAMTIKSRLFGLMLNFWSNVPILIANDAVELIDFRHLSIYLRIKQTL